MANSYSQMVQGLIDLGMTEREAKVYLALLEKGSASAPLLQKISGVPQSKIYSTTDSLVQKGFCSEKKVDRKRIYEIIDPNISFDSPIETLQTKLKNSMHLKKELANIHSTREKITEPFEYIEIIYGNDNIHHKYINLLRNTRKELLSFTRPPYSTYTEEMDQEQFDEFYAFRERGGESRWIRELTVNSPARELELCEIAASKKEAFRISSKLPLKMMIFDREILLLANEGQLVREGELTMSIIKQSTMIEGCIALFKFFWEQSLEYPAWKRMNQHWLKQREDTSHLVEHNKK